MSENVVTGKCVLCARDAEHGYLDVECYGRLLSTLRQIEDEAAILEAVPSFAQRSGGGTGSLPSHRSPVILDAIVARDPRRGLMRWSSDEFDPWGLDDTASVLETLDSWCRTVNEESGETLPDRPSVSGAREYLTANLPWIAGQPWVDEFWIAVRDLLSQLKRTNKTQEDRPVGFCHLVRFDNICGGRIWQREQERYVWRVAGDRCVREKRKINDGPAFCERCRATWDDPKELDRLHLIEEHRRLEAARPKTSDGRRMLTVKELAKQEKTTDNAIRLRLSKAGARAVRGHYDPAALEERGKSCA